MKIFKHRKRPSSMFSFHLLYISLLALLCAKNAMTTETQTCEETAQADIILTSSECAFQPNLKLPVTREIAAKLTNPTYCPCKLKHIVTFKFKKGVTNEKIHEVRQRFMELETKCLRPNGDPYIESIISGFQHSYEGFHRDQDVAFVVSFKSQGDRNYYVGEPMISADDSDLFDPVHAEFKEYVGPLLDFDNDSSIPAAVFDFCA
mmetsp:Transcript_13366/g.28333  ORF Transcript_13366/g.28333 Transcript_13366/m.28333 type:complete len:205 (-) Transcript_13366:68-682(-)